jgi:quaternary ammonium compound-resistance protein SugE
LPSSQLQGSARYISLIRLRRLIRSDAGCDHPASNMAMTHADDALTAWFALLLAGLLEVAWALGLKYSDGLTRLWPSVGMLTAIALSFTLLAVALKSIPFGTAYALWTGIGAAGTVIVGMAAFGEPTDLFRVTCLSLIIAGMVGLKLASGH